MCGEDGDPLFRKSIKNATKAQITMSAETAHKVEQTNTAVATALLLGHTGDWWDFWMILSLAFGALATAAVVVFTLGSVLVHKREARAASIELERYKTETAGKVADATAAGISAGEKAARAQSDIDAAKLELAKQEALTANARLETERLRKQLSWRTISTEQQARFVASISGRPPPGIQFTVSSISGDAEGGRYADEIVRLLHRVGVPIDLKDTSVSMFVGILPEGLFIRVRDEKSLAAEYGAALQKAFKTAGIDAPGSLIPSMPDNTVEILVGIKPRPIEARQGN
jgi:hypothetical protein